MARSPIKLTRDQREAIYQAVRTHLVGLSDDFTLLERQDDVPAAEKLAREFADDFRLLEDIGSAQADLVSSCGKAVLSLRISGGRT